MASQNEIVSIVAMIGAAYPNFSAPKETVNVYYELLKDLPADLLKAATALCCAEAGRKFAPSIGELRGAVSDIKRQAEGVPSGLDAWGELLHVPTNEYISHVTDEMDTDGRVIFEKRPYQWSHPLVRKVAVTMGWPRFPDWESESFERTAFLKVYEIELQAYLKQDNQPAEIKNYIADLRDPALLLAEKKIKQLTESLAK